MKKKNSAPVRTSKIKQVTVIDLNNEDFPEDFDTDEASYASEAGEEYTETIEDGEYIDDSPEEEEEEEDNGKSPLRTMLHILLLLIIVGIIIAIVLRLKNWGVKIDLEKYFNDHEIVYQDDTFDQILPLTTEDGQIIRGKENPTVVFLGNAPFADDRYSDDNLVNIIGRTGNATVYNCAISGSYLAALNPAYDPNTQPMDAFNFYWMTQYICSDVVDHYYDLAKEQLGDRLPEGADEAIHTLNSLDFNTVDVIAIMYDASDYLAGHEMYSDTNNTDIMQFTGNLEAGIQLLQSTYPNIRIIVMSPNYAFAVNDNGEYVSSDAYTYGQDVLSTYVIKQCVSTTSYGVSFVDNLYGTITEENAEEYLSDNLHLNKKGREFTARRFVDALTKFNKAD